MKILTDLFFKPTSRLDYSENVYKTKSRPVMDILRYNDYKVTTDVGIPVNFSQSDDISYFLIPDACDDFMFHYDINRLIINPDGVETFSSTSFDFTSGLLNKNVVDLYTPDELGSILFYKLCYDDIVISPNLYNKCKDIILAYKDVRPSFQIIR